MLRKIRHLLKRYYALRHQIHALYRGYGRHLIGSAVLHGDYGLIKVAAYHVRGRAAAAYVAALFCKEKLQHARIVLGVGRRAYHNVYGPARTHLEHKRGHIVVV